MNTRLLRLAYAFEFLLGLVAIFTAWSEIGGQATLDMMHWAWKLGFSVLLSGAVVAYTASIVSNESLWTFSSARWLTAIVLILAGMAVITYFYAMQADAGQSDETGTTTTSWIYHLDQNTALDKDVMLVGAWRRPSACAGRAGPQLHVSLCVFNGVCMALRATQGDEDALPGGAGLRPARASLGPPMPIRHCVFSRASSLPT
jgi:hypothetical protein